MPDDSDLVTLSVPREVLRGITQLCPDLTDRMHELLERNANGELSETQRAELKSLVSIVQFGQIISTALRSAL
ncbi:MAG TPA: hypothetical protein VH475_13625 [Tepidisphaeraceae bacterium]|jgi:hypothetical protein